MECRRTELWRQAGLFPGESGARRQTALTTLSRVVVPVTLGETVVLRMGFPLVQVTVTGAPPLLLSVFHRDLSSLTNL